MNKSDIGSASDDETESVTSTNVGSDDDTGSVGISKNDGGSDSEGEGLDFSDDDEYREKPQEEELGEPSSASKKDNDDDDGDDSNDDGDDSNDGDDDDGNLLHKFDHETKKNYIATYHPESLSFNHEETETMSRVVRDENGRIVDKFHKTLPFLTKYEKTRILGIRTKQINEGAKPYIDVNPTIIDGYIIAQLELEHKKLPFIIRRPIPNGGSELWKLQDLEIIC